MTPTVFSSWKEIAQFFGKSVRTVQRWERTLELPIIRPDNASGNIVLAKVADLEAWLLKPAALDAQSRAVEASQDWSRSRIECKKRVARMESLLADLTRHTERLRENTSAMSASCLRIKALSLRTEPAASRSATTFAEPAQAMGAVLATSQRDHALL